jgi:SpoVK/Ycf46/Vps4 family AAA+-type ATPase
LPDNHSDVQSVVKKNICNWLDEMNSNSNTSNTSSSSCSSRSKCCIIATSNRTDDVDPLLRRGGRLEKEIEVLVSLIHPYY